MPRRKRVVTWDALNIARRVAEEMEGAGWDVNALASAISLSPQVLRKILKAEVSLEAARAQEIARTLGVPAARFFRYPKKKRVA